MFPCCAAVIVAAAGVRPIAEASAAGWDGWYLVLATADSAAVDTTATASKPLGLSAIIGADGTAIAAAQETGVAAEVDSLPPPRPPDWLQSMRNVLSFDLKSDVETINGSALLESSLDFGGNQITDVSPL